MWDNEIEVKRGARAVASSIADLRGTNSMIFEVVRDSCNDPYVRYDDFVKRVEAETVVSPIEGFHVWMIITRLLRGQIMDLLKDLLVSGLEDWLRIPQVHLYCSRLIQKYLLHEKYGRKAA